MGQIKNLGDKWVQVGDKAIDLRAFKDIVKGSFGLFEDPEGHQFFIEVTESQLVDGEERKYMIQRYKEHQIDDWEEDFQAIIESLDSAVQ
jgi:hypothetical protein